MQLHTPLTNRLLKLMPCLSGETDQSLKLGGVPQSRSAMRKLCPNYPQTGRGRLIQVRPGLDATVAVRSVALRRAPSRTPLT
ncbi:hypothetical protein RRG08_046702 [Elysia crispata]|uniref:Uncharacterized protein n=1 Tax=Elysia crispata TaxID=231223 RepID=A0AAE1AC59_9GAST|nr:hypothetical protein RRG08_046702 [Elysia crispata]